MANSQNGYPLIWEQANARRWRVPGIDRHFYLKPGHAGFVLTVVATWFHRNIESLLNVTWDEWGWVYPRPVRGTTTVYSNHGSGTAVDLNATKHPRGVSGTFTYAQKDKVHKKLKTMLGVVRWGEDYKTTVDGMHFEINKSLFYVRPVAYSLRMFTKAGKDVFKANPHYLPHIKRY